MNEKTTSKEQLGVLSRPANLLKTIGSQFPGGSALVELQNQLADHEIEKRINSLEASVHLNAKIHAWEAANPAPIKSLSDWSFAAAEFVSRTVDVAVAYDSGFHGDKRGGNELIQPVAHACIIGESEILICREVLELALAVAEHKHGRVVILAGLAWYGIEPESQIESVGLSVLRLTERDETRWLELKKKWNEHGLRALQEADFTTPLKFSSSAWMGQEIGFVHSGEATDVMSGAETFTKRQFDVSVISHFRIPQKDGLKVAVSGVLPGRLLYSGSPVFTRDGNLLGLLSDTENYESDVGLRAVIRTLLGHPRFTKSVDSTKNTHE